MNAAAWPVDNLAMFLISLVLGVMAVFFFVVVFVADREEAKQRGRQKHSKRHARGDFEQSGSNHKPGSGREAGI
jgi:hypothetical protein